MGRHRRRIPDSFLDLLPSGYGRRESRRSGGWGVNRAFVEPGRADRGDRSRARRSRSRNGQPGGIAGKGHRPGHRQGTGRPIDQGRGPHRAHPGRRPLFERPHGHPPYRQAERPGPPAANSRTGQGRHPGQYPFEQLSRLRRIRGADLFPARPAAKPAPGPLHPGRNQPYPGQLGPGSPGRGFLPDQGRRHALSDRRSRFPQQRARSRSAGRPRLPNQSRLCHRQRHCPLLCRGQRGRTGGRPGRNGQNRGPKDC